MDHSPPPKTLVDHPVFRVGLFTGFYMLASIWLALKRGNIEFVFYIAVMIVLIGCVGLVYRRVHLSAGLLWALSIWGALHMAGGLVEVPESWPTHGEFPVLYSWWIIPKASGDGLNGWLKYDQVVHAYGFGIATWLCWQGLRGALRAGGTDADGRFELRPTPGLMVLVAAAGMGLGAMNEVVEFIATRITVTNVGGYVNTGWDLIYNTIGATLAGVILYVTRSSDT
jgi:hypothetical protein